MMTVDTPLLTSRPEGLTKIDGSTFYVIPDLAGLDPFLMSLVSDSDHWCFISSGGALTAGRRDAAHALFPYETDDRLHLAAGITGPRTVIRVGAGDDAAVWTPFGRHAIPDTQRAIAKSVFGDVLMFEEVNEALGLAIRFRWATSDRFGLVRHTSLANVGSASLAVRVADGFVNVLPAGLVPDQYRAMSNLTNAYRRSEIVGAGGTVALHTLEALMVDQAIPAESLRATVTWSAGPPAGAVTVDAAAFDSVRDGAAVERVPLITGRPGAHVVAADVELDPGRSAEWYVVADVAQDHRAVVALLDYVDSAPDLAADIETSVQRDSDALVRKLASADALQCTGDAHASAHHAANVLFNILRGGVFADGYRCDAADFRRFVAERNRVVATTQAAALNALPATIGHRELLERAAATGDPDLERLALEYLPLTFSRRHGDPSRPWNRFSIRVREPDGTPSLHYEGNWRDIFQNWEALSLSFPEYLPSMVTIFVNASTPDGFNPYRLTRSGIEWESPDPDDPWSNIGYWGDHQIVYLLRLLEAAERFVPGVVEGMLDRRIFTYADVPYRLNEYDQLVADPRSSIAYDDDAATRALQRVEDLGGDGKLVEDAQDGIYHVTLLEKLLVPALTKLSSFVPGGGIWMNTQRPEWNDANNALVGYGLSMVTLYYLRRYLSWLVTLLDRSDATSLPMTAEVSSWLTDITNEFVSLPDPALDDFDPGGRAAVMGALGRAFSRYRAKVYADGFSGIVEVPLESVAELCAAALPHLDATIRAGRRSDGLYDSYNLIDFGAGGETASIEPLPEMLEGQVGALSSGIIGSAEAADVMDALYESALYRPDQHSFLLYPDRRLPGFLEKNVIPEALVDSNPLFARLLSAGDTSVLVADGEGRFRFNAEFSNAGALATALDRLASDADWRPLVEAHGAAALSAYEEVFHHHAFTGRSGTMYAYEGLGSIYWHMVSKLLVAAQECVEEARRTGAAPTTVDRLRRSYFRIRSGIGFNKTAAEYGAFPTDPYSHTPAHAGAQQPGMTGQVKEEILTRPGELGVWFEDGALRFDPVLLRARELVGEPVEWTYVDVDGQRQRVTLDAGSLGLTVCQVPIVVAQGDGDGRIELVSRDGSVEHISGLRLEAATSREIFARSGLVRMVQVHIPRSRILGSPD